VQVAAAEQAHLLLQRLHISRSCSKELLWLMVLRIATIAIGHSNRPGGSVSASYVLATRCCSSSYSSNSKCQPCINGPHKMARHQGQCSSNKCSSK
jgi:hypothetical protein